MKIVAWIAGIVVVIVALMALYGASLSDEKKFEYEAKREVEAQVGRDGRVNNIDVHNLGGGQMTACGTVLYTPKFAGPLGLSGQVSSNFFVSKGGVVLIGVGELMGVVDEARANGCQLKAQPA